jgi:hypothetical protein
VKTVRSAKPDSQWRNVGSPVSGSGYYTTRAAPEHSEKREVYILSRNHIQNSRIFARISQHVHAENRKLDRAKRKIPVLVPAVIDSANPHG